MVAQFQHYELRLINPSFDSPIIEAIMELGHLRRRTLSGTTSPELFFQIKHILQIAESIGSARIEGNQTTISDYVEQTHDEEGSSQESYAEIENIGKAMSYIEESINADAQISQKFLRELHAITVRDLANEGDPTPGAYRAVDIKIAQSEHLPPGPESIAQYMGELIDFINRDDHRKYDLIKVAIAHHRFA